MKRPKSIYPITVQLFPDKQKSGKITYRKRYYDSIEHKYLFSEKIADIVSYAPNDVGRSMAIEKAEEAQTLLNQKLREFGGNDLFAGYQVYIREFKTVETTKEMELISYYRYVAGLKAEETRKQYERGLKWILRFAKDNKYLMKVKGVDTIPLEFLKTNKFGTELKAYMLREMAAKPRTEYQLKHGISFENAARNYLAQLIHVIKLLQTDGKLPYYVIKRIPRRDNPKIPLTDPELQILWDTPMENEDVRNSFMLECRAVGTRISDTKRLRWINLQLKEDGLYLNINMKKTNKLVHNALNTQVINSILKKRGKNGDLVFPNLPKNDQSINDQLKRWARRAGIDKRMCNHIGRVTRGAKILKLTGSIKAVAAALGTTYDVASISYSHLDVGLFNQATSTGDSIGM
jgi:integrase